jgi:hypothetical protein
VWQSEVANVLRVKVRGWALVADASNSTTQEADIRRILVQSQPRQIVHETLSQKYPPQKGSVPKKKE